MKGNILDTERPTPKDEPIDIPEFMLHPRERKVKRDTDTKDIARTIGMFVSASAMVYSFLWIDIATIPSLIGTFVGLAIFVGVANVEV